MPRMPPMRPQYPAPQKPTCRMQGCQKPAQGESGFCLDHGVYDARAKKTAARTVEARKKDEK